MKDRLPNSQLHADETKRDWRNMSKAFFKGPDGVDTKCERIAAEWHNLRTPLPPRIKYIVPVICCPSILFIKMSPYYILWPRQSEPRHNIPRACTIEELLFVLKEFNFDAYHEQGGKYFTVTSQQ